MKNTLATGLLAVAVITTGHNALAAAPAGWYLAGSKPSNYDTGLDQYATYKSLPSAFMKAKADEEGFATLMQNFSPANYLGKRIRFSANVKSEEVGRWAGLWVRVDGPGNPAKTLSFDNMQRRAIKGTSEWRRYEVVLDVPDTAIGIFMGLTLDGPGEVWLNGANFEVVPTSVPVTAPDIGVIPNSPQNLDFTR